MRKIKKVITAAVFCVIVFCFCGRNVHAADKELSVDIRSRDGISILNASGRVLYINCGFEIIPRCPDTLPGGTVYDDYVRIDAGCGQHSTDISKSTFENASEENISEENLPDENGLNTESGEYCMLTEAEVVFEPAAYKEGNIYTVSLMRRYRMQEAIPESEEDDAEEAMREMEDGDITEESAVNIEADSAEDNEEDGGAKGEENIGPDTPADIPADEFYTLSFCFDLTSPTLEEQSEIDWDSWVNCSRTCDFLAQDAHSYIQRAIVRQEGEIVYEYYATDADEPLNSCSFSADLSHEATSVNGCVLEFEVADAAGNDIRLEKRYYLDMSTPVLTQNGIGNGEYRNESLTSHFAVADTIPETTFLEYSVLRQYMDSSENVITSQTGGMGTLPDAVLNFSDEGDYEIVAVAYDMAGNKSEKMTISFRIDKSTPVIEISGFESGKNYNKPLSSFFRVEDNFADEAAFSYEILRKYPGFSECYRKGDTVINGYSETLSEYLNIDGDYIVSCRALDACGNKTEKEAYVHVDMTAPEIFVTGIEDGTATNKVPKIGVSARELFYEGTRIETVLAMKKDGGFESVNCLVNDLKSDSDSIPVVIGGEGSYLLSVTATDTSGNASVARAEFVIDYTPPYIGWLDEIDRKFIKKLSIPASLKSFVRDLTKVRISATLNSDVIEGGEEILGEGKYFLNVIAVDDAGNKSDKNVQFIIDRTAPRLIVSGLGKDGSAKANKEVKITLFDEGDRFTSIVFDGRQVIKEDGSTEFGSISNVSNVASYSFTPEASEDHKIEVVACDEAGNSTKKELVVLKASLISPDIIDGVVDVVTKQESRIETENITKIPNVKCLYLAITLIFALLLAVAMIFGRFGHIDTHK